MALGDVIQNIGFSVFSSQATLPGPALVGNSIVVFSNADDAGLTCSDEFNGAYTKVVTAGTGPRVTIFIVTNTSAASAPVITLSAAGRRSYAMELEGDLVAANAGGSAFLSPLSVGPTAFSTSTGDIPANSVSIGAWGATVDGSGITPDSPWSGVPGDNVTYPFFVRQDASAVTGGAFSGTYDGFDGTFDAAVAFVPLESAGGPSTPTISNINTTNEFTPGATNTLNGTNLSTSGGSIVIDGETQTITSRTATAIQFTGVRGGNPYNQDLTLTYTDAASNTVTQTVQQIPATGFAVTAASPNTTDDASLWTGLIDTATSDPITIVDGDQALVTDPNNLGNLAVTPAGEISADTEGDFTVQIWLASEGIWGGDQTVTFEEPVVDEAAPTISSVDVPTAGSYKAGDDLDFTGNWDKSVYATGTPQLAINVGGTTRQADYVSGDGTTALVFTYTVQAGDNDANGISVTSMALNGGSIQDAATNNADLTLNNVGDTSAVLVDTVKPVITVAGQNPYTLVVGETYTDPGATASDDQDGSLGSVTGTGSVDDETIGQYTITYPGAGVVDTAGNVADDATRTVNVVAKDAYPYSKGIKYAATQNWTWGKRHPKTGMRVRMFK